jgi:hypothetical protein
LGKLLDTELRLAFEDAVVRMRQEVDGKHHTGMSSLVAGQVEEEGNYKTCRFQKQKVFN